MIEIAKYNTDGSMTVIMDGVARTIPANEVARDRRRVEAWALDADSTWPYVPPEPTPEDARAEEIQSVPEITDLLRRLKGATPAQIDAWLTSNVTTIGDVRSLLGMILKVLALRSRG